MSLVRILVIGLLIVAGAFFLAMGLDVPIPHLGYHGLPARDIPIGIILVFAGIAVSRFWTLPQDESQLVEEWKHRKHTK
jgi:hypothetical protein